MELVAFVSKAWWGILIALVVGIAVAFIWMLVSDGERKWWAYLLAAVATFAIVFGIISIFGSIVSVPYGNVALITRYGGLTGTYLEPGLRYKVPFIDGVVLVPTQVRMYEASPTPQESGADYTDFTVDSKTQDGQAVDIAYTAKFRVLPEKADDLLQNVGTMDQAIQRVIKDTRSIVRNGASGWSAPTLYTEEGKLAFEEAMRKTISEDYALYDLELVDFLLRELDFSDQYEQAIEQKALQLQLNEQARLAVEQRKQEAEQARQVAQGQADAAVIAAEGRAQAVQVEAQAEANAIKLKNDQLSKVAESFLQYYFLQNLPKGTVYLPSTGLNYFLPLPAQPTAP